MPNPRTIRRLRRALLLLFVALVAALVALYLFGRAGRQPPRLASTAVPGSAAEDLAAVGETFEYTLDDAGVPIFEVRGDRYRLDREEKVFIDGMSMTVYGENRQPFHIESREAVFDSETSEAQLTGAVKVRGENGLEGTTSTLEVRRNGRILLGRKPVEFRYAATAVGGAQRLRGDLEDRWLALYGGVWVESVPGAELPFSLRANQLLLDRDRHQLRADDRVRLAYGPHRLNASRVNVLLSEDESQPRFARARWGVAGLLGRGGDAPAQPMVLAGDAPIAEGEEATPDGAGEESAENVPGEPAAAEPAAALTQPVAFNGSSLLVLFSPDTGAPYQLELEGADEWPALLGTSTGDGRLQRLAVGYLLGQFDDGQLSAIQVFDGVELLDLPAAAAEELGLVVSPEPAWEGETPPAGGDEELAATAGDEDLAAEQAEAEKAMEDAALAPPGAEAASPTEPSFDPVPWGGRVVTAPRAEALLEDGRTLRQVTLYEAVVYRDARLSVRGEQAVLDVVAGDGEFYGRPLELRGQRGELSAPHAVYTRSSGLLHADGGCRAQLEPSAVRGSLGAGPLGAGEGPIWVESEEAWLREVPPVYRFRGAVKAWRGEDLLLADELEADETRRRLSARGSVRTLWHPAPQPGRPAREAPVEVSAGEMEYGEAEGRLLYRKAVRAVQAGRILACQELVVELDSQQRAERLNCFGEVRIEDPASGRVIEGDLARYQLSGHTVEVEGESVRMRDESGGEVTGRRLLYDFESGTAQVQSAPPPAAAGAGEGADAGEPAEPGEGGA